MFPIYINILFIGLTLVLIALILYTLNYAHKKAGTLAAKRRNIILITLLGIVAFLGIQTLLSYQGIFSDFTTLPPKVMVLPVSCFIITAIVATRKSTARLLQQIPETWLIYVQSFRIMMEIILWRLVVEQVIPIQMSFEGHNFDILSGIIPPIIAFLVIKKKVLGRSWLIVANIIGIALLMIIFAIAIMSTPSPLRVYMNEPANTMIAHWPFVWLPGFVAPLALFFHVLSLKQLLVNKRVLT